MNRPQRRAGSGSKRNPHFKSRRGKVRLESLQKQCLLEYPDPVKKPKSSHVIDNTTKQLVEMQISSPEPQIVENPHFGESTDNPPMMPKTEIMKQLIHGLELTKKTMDVDEIEEELITADEPTLIDPPKSMSSGSDNEAWIGSDECCSQEEELRERDDFEDSGEYIDYLKEVMGDDFLDEEMESSSSDS
jgi:hypothetical protein